MIADSMLPILALNISVIFIGPLALAGVGTLFYLKSEAAGWSKTLAAVLLSVSLILQFGTTTHFLVPLGIQLILCIWLVLYYQFGD